jgi:hypothetical protein
VRQTQIPPPALGELPAQESAPCRKAILKRSPLVIHFANFATSRYKLIERNASDFTDKTGDPKRRKLGTNPSVSDGSNCAG